MNIERQRELKIKATEILAETAIKAACQVDGNYTEGLCKRELNFLISQIERMGKTLQNRAVRMKDSNSITRYN